MSISLVQSQTLNNGANVLVSPNTAGNVLLVYALYDGTSAGTISVSDSNGNSYTQLAYHTFATGGPQTSAVALFVAKNINAGANTITLSNSQTSTGHFAVIAEYSGVDTTNPVSANQFQAYPFPPGTSNLAVTIATALNNDKLALFYQNRNCTGISLPGGFTSQQQVIAGGDASGYSDATIATAGSASYTVNFTTTGATGGAIWAVVLNQPSFSISGNAGVAGALVSFTGSASGSVTADGVGAYSIPVLLPGTYTVTPTLAGYSFTPTSSSPQTITNANITGLNFTATGANSISGNCGAAGEVLNLTGSATGSTTSDASGNYSFIGLGNGTYTVTPAALAGSTFTPSNISGIVVSGSNITGQNFVATFTISGTVGTTAGVSVALTGHSSASTTTGSGGSYSFPGLAGLGSSYTVTPASQVTPASASITINHTSVTQNFVSASNVTGNVSTITPPGSAIGAAGETVLYFGTSSGTLTCDSSGNFAVLLAAGVYLFQPTTIATFAPFGSQQFAVDGENDFALTFLAEKVLSTVSGRCLLVPGATVTLIGPGGTFTTTADSEGNYSVSGLPAGTYQVTVTDTNSAVVGNVNVVVSGGDYTTNIRCTYTIAGTTTPGVTVTCKGSTTNLTTVSDASTGQYSFLVPFGVTYVVSGPSFTDTVSLNITTLGN